MSATSCRSCQKTLGPEAVDAALRILICDHCGAIFERSDGPAGGASERRKPRPQPPTLPDGLRLASTGARLKISRSWFKVRDLIHFPISFMVLSMTSLVHGSLSLSVQGKANPGLMFLIFGGLTAFGLIIGYWAVANVINRAQIEVTPRQLRIWHSPLPWWSAGKLPIETIEQLYCVKKVFRSRYGERVTFQLRALIRDRRRSRLLLKEIDSIQQALWLEQEIELQLGVRNRPVEGEVEKPKWVDQ